MRDPWRGYVLKIACGSDIRHGSGHKLTWFGNKGVACFGESCHSATRWLNGQDLRSLRFVRRKARLRKLVGRQKSRLLYLDHLERNESRTSAQPLLKSSYNSHAIPAIMIARFDTVRTYE